MSLEEIKKLLNEVIYYNSEARRDLSNEGACKRCANARDRIIELSEPEIANIYKAMKERGTKTGCQECVDIGIFSVTYLLLLELGRPYSNIKT